VTKYAANAMLATRISFMNQMARFCELVGADVNNVRLGIGSDQRIGRAFLYPGPGYGGSCFPKDVKALQRSARDVGHQARVLTAVEAVNDAQKHVLFAKISRFFGGQLAGRRIAVWGLAFKPNTDDLREAPSRVLLENLWAAGASVRAYDPIAMPETRRIYGTRPDLELCESAVVVLDGCDALAIVTEWQEFRSPDFGRIKAALRQPLVFDGRNLYEPSLMARLGIRYFAIGRGERIPYGERTSG
jgi:UDPglucose 6-dehydrogenase